MREISGFLPRLTKQLGFSRLKTTTSSPATLDNNFLSLRKASIHEFHQSQKAIEKSPDALVITQIVIGQFSTHQNVTFCTPRTPLACEPTSFPGSLSYPSTGRRENLGTRLLASKLFGGGDGGGKKAPEPFS